MQYSSKEVNDINAEIGDQRSILFFAAIIFAAFVVWAFFAEIDEVSRAPGHVMASSRTQVIQSQDGGVLEELLVAEGDKVVAGQLLAKIDKTRAEAAFLETRAQVAALSARTSRLEAELFDSKPMYDDTANEYPEFISNQNKLIKVRRKALQDELKAISDIQKLIQKELDMNLPLVEMGDVSMTEVLRLERQVADYSAQKTIKRNEYIQELQNELSKSREELTAMRELMQQRLHILNQTELKSPMNGIVKNVRITTLSGVIKPGEDIMQIVPSDDDLLIEAKMSPSDIGFVKIGMPVSIKIDAYDPSIYGDLPGELIFISADTLDEDLKQNESPYYRIRVKSLGRSFSAKPDLSLEIQPGMTSTAEIKTGKRTVMQFITKPIIKTLSSSLGER